MEGIPTPIYDDGITTTEKPTATPSITEKPTATPAITAKPTATPTITEKPTATPSITEKPTATITTTAKPYTEPLALLAEDGEDLLMENGVTLEVEGTI